MNLHNSLKAYITQPEYNRTEHPNMCGNTSSMNGKKHTSKDETTSFYIRFVVSVMFSVWKGSLCRQANYQGVSNVIVATWMQGGWNGGNLSKCDQPGIKNRKYGIIQVFNSRLIIAPYLLAIQVFFQKLSKWPSIASNCHYGQLFELIPKTQLLILHSWFWVFHYIKMITCEGSLGKQQVCKPQSCVTSDQLCVLKLEHFHL